MWSVARPTYQSLCYCHSPERSCSARVQQHVAILLCELHSTALPNNATATGSAGVVGEG